MKGEEESTKNDIERYGLAPWLIGAATATVILVMLFTLALRFV